MEATSRLIREGTFLIRGAEVFLIFFLKKFVALPFSLRGKHVTSPIPILPLHMHRFTTIGNSKTFPDYDKLTDSHNLQLTATSIDGHEPDDCQPRAQMKKCYTKTN